MIEIKGFNAIFMGRGTTISEALDYSLDKLIEYYYHNGKFDDEIKRIRISPNYDRNQKI